MNILVIIGEIITLVDYYAYDMVRMIIIYKVFLEGALFGGLFISDRFYEVIIAILHNFVGVYLFNVKRCSNTT